MGRVRRIEQLTFDHCTPGGARAGAGRPRTKDGVSHLKRAQLSKHHPVHVTLRLRKGLPSMRRRKALRALQRAMAAGKERFGFRLNHYSIQSNHLHMIVEADDRRALSRGMQGLAVRMARALNKLWGRTGKLFADRYHDVILRSPTRVRHALAYVLNNALRHRVRNVAFPDLYSSGEWFGGWEEHAGEVPTIGDPLVVTVPRTWLQRVGWWERGGGFFSLHAVPGARHGRRA